MRHKILVIDDQYEGRADSYTRLENACTDPAYAAPPSFEIELIYAMHPHETQRLLNTHAFSAVILDVVLKKGLWKDTSAEKELSKITDDIPVALLSSEWASKEVKNLVSAWPTKNCRMFIHWNDISEDKNVKEGSLTRVLCELAKYIETYKSLDYSIRLEDKAPIRILHLSDLQFGGFADWKLKLEVPHVAQTIRNQWKEGPTFIVITGDIAEHGLPAEYEAAYKWLSDLASEFKWTLPSSRIFLVPGNHDVCLPFAAASMLSFQETEESQKARVSDENSEKKFRVDFMKNEVNNLTDYAFRPYLDFCKQIAPRPYLSLPDDPEQRKDAHHSHTWVEARFRHLGLVFFGLNTAQPIHHRTVPGCTVPKSAVELLVKELQESIKDSQSPTPLIIGLTHHHPLEGQTGMAVKEPQHFTSLFRDVPRVALWLHGHWHQRETNNKRVASGHQLIYNAAPTPTVRESHRPPDTARGFSMIEINRPEKSIAGCTIYAIEWDSGKGLMARKPEGHEYTMDGAGYFLPC